MVWPVLQNETSEKWLGHGWDVSDGNHEPLFKLVPQFCGPNAETYTYMKNKHDNMSPVNNTVTQGIDLTHRSDLFQPNELIMLCV